MGKKKKRRAAWLAALLLLAVAAGVFFVDSAEYDYLAYRVRFGVTTSREHLPMVRAARAYIETQPVYVSAYYAGGYPPDGEGVCTDVIWRAFRAEGIDLKALVDADIQEDMGAYPEVNNWPDANIDFRRVSNLKVFFSRHALSLTTDAADVAAWQPGDVVIYDGHIALVSDRRNEQGVPYILHHAGYGPLEEDALTSRPILYHFRWEE